MGIVRIGKQLFITACAYTRTTDLAARWLGATSFLPELFVLRYSNMGGLDPHTLAGQIRDARSFRDDRWSAYWDAIAGEHAGNADNDLRELAGEHRYGIVDLANREATPEAGDIESLSELIAPAAALFADHGPQLSTADIADIVARHGDTSDQYRITPAYRAIDAWVKAITYYQIGAFPGHAPQRMRSYRRSRLLFDALISALAPAADITVEHIEIPVGSEVVRGCLILPPGPGPHPVVLSTNGLEGTVQELAIPQLRYRTSGLAIFMMEMPGSYAYHQPMRPESETIYREVIDHLVADDRLDTTRLGMVGVSFGGYWTARMAANDDRLSFAVACGAPTHRSFHGGSLGTPEVIVGALRDTTGAANLLDLARKLRALSIRDRCAHINIPLLAINGDHDTLISTQDTVDLAEAAPHATLLLYPDDDHCAMHHYRQWLDHSQKWISEQVEGHES